MSSIAVTKAFFCFFFSRQALKNRNKNILLQYTYFEVIILKIKWKTLLICIAIPLAVGILSGLISRSAMDDFRALEQPPLSPPAWLFPVVWTILYVLMGISLYLIVISGAPQRRLNNAFALFGTQLFFNFFWPIIFFNLGAYYFAFAWLVIMLVIIILCAVSFYSINKRAGYLWIPYVLWVSFAGYLNLAIAVLN